MNQRLLFASVHLVMVFLLPSNLRQRHKLTVAGSASNVCAVSASAAKGRCSTSHCEPLVALLTAVSAHWRKVSPVAFDFCAAFNTTLAPMAAAMLSSMSRARLKHPSRSIC